MKDAPGARTPATRRRLHREPCTAGRWPCNRNTPEGIGVQVDGLVESLPLPVGIYDVTASRAATTAITSRE